MPPWAASKRPGRSDVAPEKGALHVAEQFAFGQGFGQRRAVHLDHGLLAAARMAVQAAGEQVLAHAGLAQQQDGQVGIGHQVQFVQQRLDGLAVAQDLGGFADAFQPLLGAAQLAQLAVFAFQVGDPHGGLQDQAEPQQPRARGLVEGAGGERVQRHDAPGAVLAVQRHAHAVVYRQRRALAVVQQAVVGVGQHAFGVEPGGLAARQDGGETRMLGDDEAPPQGFVGQAGGGDQVQGVGGVQHQQADGVAGKGLADGRGGALQAYAIGQVGGQIIEKRRFHRVIYTIWRYFSPC